MKKSLLILLIALSYIPIYGQDVQLNNGPAADSILGTWQTADQKSRITITRKDSLYYGKLSNATLSIDKKINLHLPTSLLGIYILQDFKYSGDNRWDGMIFDPKSKKTYKCYLKLEDDGTMKVRGYKGISLFGKSQYWTRIR
ncbi:MULTISPECIES: DUF2147 domain-containing protein [unclassified Mucilaginibacter]|uniref:DUF2147 domain-containing protein n=1 Tax=unclassified Mucilaginibacter TaxID=2617802 RepID=UPI00096221DD|nr:MULTISPECIES: DUF2147 domain-containing protein [unclassified Mucilaginibacter]OJW17392.1 MAG: hypothetical protein BGO48_07535 [Mucilaginibacter sp. 44-25]PLW90608.1 MAG: DUF2147 domain-containing protein [Mucilaginibacter sp.]PMP65936.1 MAG: DUF2147 domain-containing protein [Mucilaginibacter sp.]HEK19972.1 DUF2147 domain-containing protein [Bacteroidota bacterium]